jgi:hypothetical protein
MWLSPTLVSVMQKRILLLPLIWGGYGLSEVFGLSYVFGPILNSLPYPQNDKPISGSYLPALAFNVGALLILIGLSLYSLGIWNLDFSSRKNRIDLVALMVSTGSLFLLFYNALFLFPAVASLVYLLATNLD